MDDPDWKPFVLGQISEVVLTILAQPGKFVWAIVGGGGEKLHSVNCVVYFANSLAWGVGLAFLRAWWLQRSRD